MKPTESFSSMTNKLWKIPLFDLNYDASEKEAVLDVLNSKWLTSGQKNKEFENKFSEYLGGNILSSTVSSGTSALYIALLACRVGPGDEVIISGLSFVAALNVVVLTGATPILADAKSIEDWNVSPDEIASKITARSKAIIIVHFAGYPCDMEEIATIAKTNDLILIEDAAHAVGAEYKGRKCGTLCDIGCFSFFSNKNLSVGEGGMFVTRDKALNQKARLIRSHGMTAVTIDRHQGKAVTYDVTCPGLNFRMDEIRAAIGIVQLKKLDTNNMRRKNIVQLYIERLGHIDGISIPWRTVNPDRKSSYHIFPILLAENTDRQSFIAFLKQKGIQTSIHYPDCTQFSFYKRILKNDLKVAREISSRAVTLPLFPGMDEEDVMLVANSLTEYHTKALKKI